MKSFIDYLTESGCTCWKGYKRKPGTKPCEEGSCVKEETELDEDILISFLNEYYTINPNSIPKSEFY